MALSSDPEYREELHPSSSKASDDAVSCSISVPFQAAVCKSIF